MEATQAGTVKQVAAKKLGLCGEEVQLVLGEDTVSDQLKAEELSGCMLKLVVLSPGSIAASVGNRIVVASGSTLKTSSELDYGKTKRRSPYAVGWNPTNADQLAICGKNLAWIHDFATGQEQFSRAFKGQGPSNFHWSADGRRLAFLNFRDVTVCDVNLGTENVLSQRSDVFSASFHPGGSCMAVGQTDGIAICDLERGSELHFFHSDSVELVQWDSSGNLLASGDINGTLRVLTCTGEVRWNLRQCDAARQMGLQDKISSIAWSPVDSFIAFSSSWGMAVQLFDANKGELVWKTADYCPFHALSWNYNGIKVAGACQDGHVYVFDGETGELHRSLELGKAVTSLSWSVA
ncbi:unnamed protein product [Effrenium voratum]|uniref:Anaphase-promoting complex subunit 4-like WD40 domain-containing protein n=1 Tax=Effrenium voratum TaxID=2562239 RepID=A0AA36N9U8_9DINO|nr:unnamed protein product [Effrenium voratum]